MRTFSDRIGHSSSVKCFVLAGIFIGVSFFVLQKIHHRDGLADFRVYYDAARTWLAGESPYGQAFGISSGYYKYSPAALLPFSLIAWMPYTLAAGIYYFLILAALLLFSLIVVQFIEKQFAFSATKRGWILAMTTVFLADHFERELHLGNVNVFLLIAAFGLYHLVRKDRMSVAGLFFAAILLFKPHFAILLPYFIWNKKWGMLIYTFAGLAAGFLAPVIISGWTHNISHHWEWITAIQDHNVGLSNSPNTIFGIVNDWILHWLNIHGGMWLVIVLLIVTILGYTSLLLYNRTNPDRNRSFFLEFFILVALIPNLTHTDTEHFMWSWPLIAFVISVLFNVTLKRRWIYIT